jgi:hypothetical protein
MNGFHMRYIVLTLCAWTLTGTTSAQRGTDEERHDLAQLRAIAKSVAEAVLKKDVRPILVYDRPEFRAEDATELTDTKSVLHCYLFDTKCSNVRSVYDRLTSARRLETDVSRLPSADGKAYAIVLFFDGARMKRSDLRSRTFRCDHVQDIASWLFVREQGHWVSANHPFDAETDTLCSP